MNENLVDTAAADAWMEVQDQAFWAAIRGLVKEHHLTIRSARNTKHYRFAAYLRRLYPRRLIRVMAEAELRAEAYRQKKETRDVFPDMPSALTAIEDCFISNLRSAGYDVTRENWSD